jgi:hypothetical protein
MYVKVLAQERAPLTLTDFEPAWRENINILVRGVSHKAGRHLGEIKKENLECYLIQRLQYI